MKLDLIGAIGMRGGEQYGTFWWKSLQERGHLETLGVDGMIILKKN